MRVKIDKRVELDVSRKSGDVHILKADNISVNWSTREILVEGVIVKIVDIDGETAVYINGSDDRLEVKFF